MPSFGRATQDDETGNVLTETVETKEVPGAENAGPLSPEELPQEGTQLPPPVLDGRRIRAIPYENGSTIIVDPADFKAHGITHPRVTFDYRKDDFTLKVGDKISEEAAELLTREFPTQFEYMNEG